MVSTNKVFITSALLIIGLNLAMILNQDPTKSILLMTDLTDLINRIFKNPFGALTTVSALLSTASGIIGVIAYQIPSIREGVVMNIVGIFTVTVIGNVIGIIGSLAAISDGSVLSTILGIFITLILMSTAFITVTEIYKLSKGKTE